ncbi:MAG TPA: DUF6799 domain-containing protein [Bacteroidia bacterium]|jgi:hypothetical protein|nr:DUF6799 domain-containing protein [Bacteroidia bacterium]
MKKLILIVAVTASSLSAFSQIDSVKYQIKDGMQIRTNDSIDVSKICVTLNRGKLMVAKNGILVPMEEAMVLQNGTIVMMSGMIKTKDGKVSQINEGDCLDMNGEMVPLMNNKMLNDGPPK